MKLTTTTSYTIKFQVADGTIVFGPLCDTLALAVAQWDIAMSADSSADYIIEAHVTKEVK